jgi:hypothetical protein
MVYAACGAQNRGLVFNLGESEGSGASASIGDPARGDHRRADGIGDLRNQRHCSDLQSDRAVAVAIEGHAPMPTDFIALSNHGIDTTLPASALPLPSSPTR